MTPNQSDRHSLAEDAFAITTGALLVSLGVVLYARATLLVGGSSGLALLIQYATGMNFWAVFSIANFPFYALAVARMGWGFALRTFAAVTLVSALVGVAPDWIAVTAVHPLYACIVGGFLIGTGMLVLFRHRTGLGGVNILALYLQDALGWRATYVQLGLDIALLAAAFAIIPPDRAALSALGALIVNLILLVNHRPGRYMGYS